MPLEDYRKKRDFNETPEPAGRQKPREAAERPIFVVQKHKATSLHYDFRLEIEGVLVSWAVPKGPSLNTANRRLAIRTEDHPLEYADFEGVIPEGQYGAGTVMVWDRGTYEVEPDRPAADQLARGELKFNLHGQKLQGGFVLIRTGRGSAGQSWLLIKRRDEHAVRSWKIERYDWSVLTGRSLEEIAAGVSPRPRKYAVPALAHVTRKSARLPSAGVIRSRQGMG
jgi:bifunctional non-homologous end joining protein LigD